MVRIRFEGGQELADRLGQLSTRVSRTVTYEALRQGGAEIQGEAGRIAPHEPGFPDLRDNIGMSVARSVVDTEGLPAVAIGPTKKFFYGLFQEFGTRHHSAQPFMRPSFESMWRPALGIIRGEFWRVIISRGVGSVRGTGGAGGGLS
jgi:HK97 gp10 family phage protein